MYFNKGIKVLLIVFYLFISIFLGSGNLSGNKYSYAADMMDVTVGSDVLNKAPGYDYTSAVKGVKPEKVTFNEEQLKKAKIIWKRLKSETDFTDIQIAGNIGNIYQESLFKNDVVNSIGAIGICQWLGARRTGSEGLQTFASSKGTSEKDLNTQVDFLVHETTVAYKDLYYAKMKKTKTLADATAVFMIWYETPGVHEAMFGRRLGAAKEAYEKIAGKDLGDVDAGDSETSDEDSGSGSSSDSGDGEYTGALEFDPFIKGKPVQNTTGVDYKNKEIGASEGYIFASFFSKVIYIIMLVALVLTAMYIVSISVLILGIALDSAIITDNKLLRKIGGDDFTDNLRAYGITGSLKQIGMRFGIPVIILNLVILGVVGQVQNLLVSKVIEVIEILF